MIFRYSSSVDGIVTSVRNTKNNLLQITSAFNFKQSFPVMILILFIHELNTGTKKLLLHIHVINSYILYLTKYVSNSVAIYLFNVYFLFCKFYHSNDTTTNLRLCYLRLQKVSFNLHVAISTVNSGKIGIACWLT